MKSSASAILFVLAARLLAQTGESPARPVAPKENVSAATLVKAGDGTAVVRLGAGGLETVKVGDRVGATKAVVKEIGAGRIVLEEIFTGADGRPNRALIVIKEGERGGTRYLQRSDEKPKVGTRIVSPPAAKSAPAKKPH
jgi:hypothetical protein